MDWTDSSNSENSRIYLDHNATTPLSSELKDKAFEGLSFWGNASSLHYHGQKSKKNLRLSRQAIAQLIHCEPSEVVFTSGGSESNQIILFGLFQKFQGTEKTEYIFSSVEHPSVMKFAKFLQKENQTVHFLNVNKKGELDLEQYKKLLNSKTALVSVMFANNETGHIFPINEMSRLASEKNILFHCDAVQALGKIPLNMKQSPMDFASFSCHKFYSLKGTGFFYMKDNTSFSSFSLGGEQERGLRSGTENNFGIFCAGEMAKKEKDIVHHSQQMKSLRDFLEEEVSKIPKIQIVGKTSSRLPNTTNFIIENVSGESLVMALDLKGFSVSSGSACSSGKSQPSPVLLNMGFSEKEALSSLRVSLGWGTTKEHIEKFISTLKTEVERIRSL